jgi:hypothetical protein
MKVVHTHGTVSIDDEVQNSTQENSVVFSDQSNTYPEIKNIVQICIMKNQAT